MERRILSQKHK